MRLAVKWLNHLVWFWMLALVLFGCAPVIHPPIQINQPPVLTSEKFVAHDGATMPAEVWLPSQPTRAVIVAVHGFNDYRNAFALPGPYFAERGIAFYSYDQRGFGATSHRGLWPGKSRLQVDLYHFVATVKRDHPDVPLYILGDSMGAAVVVSTLVRFPSLDVAGSILNAPAIWGGETMNLGYRLTLWLVSHSIPWYTVTGEGLGVRVTDNIPLLREMSKDDFLIRETRFDALYGLVQLMDEAHVMVPQLSHPILILYGQKDEVIPVHSICSLVERVHAPLDIHFYPQGYHLLLRDLQADEVWKDISIWIKNEDNRGSSSLDDLEACRKELPH